jgi:hypothetical protein
MTRPIKSTAVVVHPSPSRASTLPASLLGTQAIRLPDGLIPSNPRDHPLTISGFIATKFETARYREFERQTGHVANAMNNMERVQGSFIELRNIQMLGQKRAAEITKDIATIEAETREIRARGRRQEELYPEQLAHERTTIIAATKEVERQTALNGLELETEAIVVRTKSAESDRAVLILQSEGRLVAAENNLKTADAEASTAKVRARTAAEVRTLEGENRPILPREVQEWEERKTTAATNRAEDEARRVAEDRIRTQAAIVTNQAIAGAVQVPEINLYSAYSWVTYQQEYDRFHADHEKALEATINHLTKRMSNGGISLADAAVSYETYQKMIAQQSKGASKKGVQDFLGSLGIS